MKKVILQVLTVIACTTVNAQAPDFVWVKQTSGIINETPVAVSLDASGNIYTSGYFEGTVDFDPGTLTYTLVSPAGVKSMYISKSDAQANLLWAKQVSTPVSMAGAEAHPNAQVLCSNGDLCIAGFYSGAFDFDPGASNFYMAAATENAFVLKVDTQGNFVWSKQWGGSFPDMATGIAVDAADAVYTTGFFMDTVDFDPGAPIYTVGISAANTPAAFVSKLDAAGNFSWVKKLTSNSGSIGNDICLDATGNIYSTGTFIGSTDFDPGIGILNITSVNDQDIYAWKLDASGSLVWAKTMGGTTKEGGTAIITDASNNVFVSGFFTGVCDFDPGAGTFNITSSGADDMFTLKLDAQGILLWAQGRGGSSTDVVSKMAIDASGAVYSTGQFFGTVDFDPGAGTYNLSATTAIHPFISKYDAQGFFKWAKVLSGTDYASGSDIAINSSGDVFTVGIFSLTTDFDPNSGTYTMTAAGQIDGYLHKMSCGISPVINATSSASMICKGENVVLTPSGANTYSLNASGGNSFTVSPTANTNYTISGKDLNGCLSEITITQLVAECTGLENYSLAANVNVFPNPNNGEFVITTLPSTQVTIFNNLGQVILKKGLQNDASTISMKDFPAGVYFVEAIYNGDRQVLKMIKE